MPIRRQREWFSIYYKVIFNNYSGGERGIIFVFCHFIRKTRIFRRLRTSLSSLFRLGSALQSLLWTSKVPKKSSMSNKLGPPSCAYSSAALAARI